MMAGLTASRYCRRWRVLLSSVSMALRLVMSAQAPTSSDGRPASSLTTLNVSWIQM